MSNRVLDLDDSFEEEFSLIGIHTTLEDYKLAYLLNRNLKTRFKKSKEELTFEKEKKEACFSIYDYENIKYDFKWFLISNSFRIENQSVSNQLLLTSEIKTYLIPEKKKVDFFIKISGGAEYSFVEKTAYTIKSITEVITAYSIDKNTLKSKDFLTF